jgi:hypothetical protein
MPTFDARQSTNTEGPLFASCELAGLKGLERLGAMQEGETAGGRASPL